MAINRKEYPNIPAVVGGHDTADGMHLVLAIASLASSIDAGGSVAYFTTEGLIDFIIEADAYVAQEQRRLDDENYLDAFLADLLALIEAEKSEEELDFESELEELYEEFADDAEDYVETDTEDFPE